MLRSTYTLEVVAFSESFENIIFRLGFWVWSRKTMMSWRKCSQSLLVYKPQDTPQPHPKLHETRDHPVQSQRRISGHSSATTGAESSRSPKSRYVPDGGLYAFAVVPPSDDVTDSQTLSGGRSNGYKCEALQQPLINLTTNRVEGSVLP